MANELKTTLDLDIKPFLDALKRVATQVQSLEEIRPKFNTQEFQKIQAEISRFKPEINVAVNVDKRSLDAVENELATIGEDPVDIELLVNSEEIQRSINRVRELRNTALTIPPITNLNVESNIEEVANQINQITFTPDKNIIFDVQFDDTEVLGTISRVKKAINEFNGQELNLDFREAALGILFLEKEAKQLGTSLLELTGTRYQDIQLDLDPTKIAEAITKLRELKNEVQIVDANDVNVNVNANTNEANNRLNIVEQNVNDIPNQKNIKINVDQSGLRNVSQATSGIGGFVGQLGTGLVASFSGAAVGAAIANFATNSVRAIARAADEADGLQDALRLAFTQVGVPQFELPNAIQRANQFAFELGDNFGISIQRSQLLLSQVVGLTGEFGNTSEAITKAALGIETATGGLVKAETAAKLFSRSIGNPEDQAALETLAKRFPAIGEAIQNATDPAEKANAVIANLAGTFASLEEQSRGFAENFRLLGEVALGVFAGALAPVFDSFVPILEQLTNLFAENADEISAFGQRIVEDFTQPLVSELIAIGPQLSNFFDGLTSLFNSISQNSFNALTISIQALGVALNILGDVLKIIAPFANLFSDILSTILKPIVEALEGDFLALTDPLNLITGGLIESTEATSGLAPLLQLLQNVLGLLIPVISDVAEGLNPILTSAINALFIALGPINLILIAINKAFELGKSFIKEFGDEIENLTTIISNAVGSWTLLLTPLTRVLALLNYISKASRDAQKPTEQFSANLFDSVDAASQFTQGIGINLPQATSKATGGLKILKDATDGANKSATESLSVLGKQIQAYEQLSRIIENRYTLETNQIKLLQAETEKRLGRELTDSEKLFQQQLEVVALKEKQIGLEKSLADAFGISADNIAKFGEEYIKTGDLSGLPIKFDPTDQKSVDEARKVAEQFVKLVNDRIALETQETQYDFNINRVNFQLDRDAITTQVDFVQEQINDVFRGLQVNDVAIGNFDATQLDIFRRNLEDIKAASTNSLKPLIDRFRETGAQIQSTTRDLNALEVAGRENTTEYGQIRQRLRNLVDEYKVLDGQTKAYRDTIRGIDSQLLDFGDTIDQVVSDKFRRLTDIQELNITFDLNAQGLNEGLIEIERNFARSVQAINSQFEAQRLRIESGVGQTQQSAEALAEAQTQALRNVAVQRELALRQFRLQNDAFFAINESLRRNLGSVFAPDTAEAQRGLDQRKNELNSQSELLKANLELGIISYQEYNSKILELEKERTEAIKEFDDSVRETRLNNLKQIAEDALPALNNQLLLSQTELSVLLQDGTATFTDVANKGLETIGVIAAQSLAIAVQQAQDLEQIEKLFVKTAINNILRVLQAELIAAALKAVFKETAEKGPLGLITGALLGGALAVLFAQAESKLVALLGYEQGGYTGDGGRKEVAGVVHGQEFVMNADATKKNRPVLEWLNKTNGTFEQYIAKTSKETLTNDKFSILNEQVMRNFDNRLSNIELQVADRNNLNVNNYIDTKSMSSSINGLAYTMDSRLASLETTVDKAIRQNATLTKSANQLDVSVFADPGTTLKYAKKIGKIKGLS